MSNIKYVGVTCNGYPYKEIGDTWVPDEGAREIQLSRERDENQRKDDLWFALRSRILSLEEMAEVRSLGEQLLVRWHGGMSDSYVQEDVERRLNEGLLQQFRLMVIRKTDEA